MKARIPKFNIRHYKCYLEEFSVQDGLGVRLRDKVSNKRVEFVAPSQMIDKSRTDLLNFYNTLKHATLQAEKENGGVRFTFYERSGENFVFLSGEFVKETPDMILIKYNENLKIGAK